MKAQMLENVYEGFNARCEVYLSKEYFCEIYPACVSSKLQVSSNCTNVHFAARQI